jgi:hypothetical protein
MARKAASPTKVTAKRLPPLTGSPKLASAIAALKPIMNGADRHERLALTQAIETLKEVQAAFVNSAESIRAVGPTKRNSPSQTMGF